jgi:hypothetical protein
MGPRLSISKAYTIVLDMQSHGLSMNPVSIEQLRATLRQKSKCSQRQNWRAVSKQWCKLKVDTNKLYKDLNLVFANHGKEDKIYPLRTKIPSKRDSKGTKQRSIIKDPYKYM